MEYVRSLAERSDFIGGIDNEALDFDHLDRYMQTVPSVRSHSESNTDTSDPIALQSGPGATLIDNVNLTPVTAIESSFSKTSTDHDSPDNVYRPVDLRGLRLIAVPSDDGTELSKTIGNSAINEVNETDPKKDCYTSFNDHPTITGDIAENLPIDNLTKPVRLPTTPAELTNLNGLHLYHNSALISTNHFRHHDHHDQQSPANESVLFRTDSIPEQIAGEKETEIPKKHDEISPSSHFPEQPLHPVVIGASLESLQEIAIFDGDCNTSQSHLLNLDSSQTNSMETPGVIPEQFTTGESLSTSISASEMISSNTLSYKRKRKFDSNNSSDIKPEPDTSTYPSFNSPSTCRQQRFQQRSQPLKNTSPIDTPQSLPDSNPDLNQQNLVVPDTSTLQCIRFAPFDEQNWHVLCDQYLKSMPIPNYRVDADKGFNFSNADDAFVCQKKNHFQITCHIQLQGEGKFVRTRTGLEKIKFFQLHFYGVKLEAPTHKIRVEQSQSDRSKKPFHPVPIDLEKGVVRKVTVGRLHFSETTSNNMRKKGRPNPEQRYFQLVVSLHAHTNSTSYPLISHGSERIIVRASNPGQFDSDVELCWQHGINDSIFHVGHVGINTDRPDESLVVHGNLKISGHIVQPSDFRAKQKIHELDPAKQLKNLQKIRVVQYQYHPEFAVHSGLRGTQMNCVNDIGVIAQEVQKVIPDAVQEAGNVVLPSGRVIENFLLVNKDRIFMESVGAIKELYRINENLQKRLELLERNKLFTYNQNSDRLIRNILLIWIILLAIWITTVLSLYTIENRRKQYPNQFNYTNLTDQTFMNNINTFNCDHMKYQESSIKKIFIDLRVYKCCYYHQKDHEICPNVFTTQYHSNQTYHYLHLELLSRKWRYLLPS